VTSSFQRQQWPRELQLVAAAAVRRLDDAARERIAALLTADLDWEDVCALAAEHAVAPLVYWNLASVATLPEAAASAFRAGLEANMRNSLLLSAELGRVTSALRQADVDAIAYKGPALAQRLYGNVGLRCFTDLDLLIERTDRERAVPVLLDLGYKSCRTIADPKRQEQGDCEEQFAARGGALVLDLHWQIAQPYLSLGPLPGGWQQRARTLLVGTTPVRIFAPEDDLLVLAVHGGKHVWDQMSWLADFAAALDLADFDWDTVLRGATEMRARHHLLLGATLAHLCFDSAVPAAVLDQARQARVPWRYAQAIAAHYADPQPHGLLRRWAFNLRMRERWSDRVRAAARFALLPGTLELEEEARGGRSALLAPVARVARVAGNALKAAAGAEKPR
jgi:hypothetical protein